jgi:hypothetical protein
LERLKKHPDFDIKVLAVISEESMISLCEAYGVNCVMHKNEPLGEKKNFGLEKARDFEFDYLMEIGSDDLILNELLDSYKPLIEAKDNFFGISDAAYIDSSEGNCRRLMSRATYGAGRMISRSALQRMRWRIWADKLNRGLDNNSVFNFQKAGFVYNKVTPIEYPCVIDVKSRENIWKFNYFLGVEYSYNECVSRLSEDERNYLQELIEQNVTVEAENR